MGRFSSPFLSSLPCALLFAKMSEWQLHYPTINLLPLIPFPSCSVFHYLSLLRPQDERNRRQVVEEEKRDERYRRGLRDQVMLTGTLPHPIRIKAQVPTMNICVSFLVYHTYTRAYTSRISVRGNAWSRFCGIGSPRKEDEEERGEEEELEGRRYMTP